MFITSERSERTLMILFSFKSWSFRVVLFQWSSSKNVIHEKTTNKATNWRITQHRANGFRWFFFFKPGASREDIYQFGPVLNSVFFVNKLYTFGTNTVHTLTSVTPVHQDQQYPHHLIRVENELVCLTRMVFVLWRIKNT